MSKIDNPTLVEVSSQNGQRAGQFLHNAISDYLRTHDREMSDHDVANVLFYISNDDLERIVGTYADVLTARSNYGFKGDKK